MKLTSPSAIKALIARYDLIPSRVLGQNFLADENILHIILDSAHLAAEDRVLEIGPGLGVLTEQLVARAAHVVAIEKDPRLSAYLRETYAHRPGLQLIEGDALDQSLSDLLARERITHVVSNLPYSAGTRILIELIDSPHRPLRMVVMLQSDVAERLAAPPGSKVYGIAGIHAQMYYEVLLRKTVSPTCFYPRPEVKSALIELYRRPEPQTVLREPAFFNKLVQWCFSQRRKQIGRILTHAPADVIPSARDTAVALRAAGIEPDQRPESIAVATWGRLANELGTPGPVIGNVPH